MSEQLQETADRLTTFISQTFAAADTAPGSVISELVIKLAASLQNTQYNLITDLSQSKSISQVLGSSVDTYSSAIDLIASNYNTNRSSGKYSTGQLRITVTSNGDYTIPGTVRFIQPALGLTYKLTNTYRVTPSKNPTRGELTLRNNGNEYYFILPVVAEEVGMQYQVSSGASFALIHPSTIAYFVKAEAYGNFSTGLPVDTDKAVVKKIKKTLGSRRLESPAGITNRLSEQFDTFQALSVCGANDIELTRAKENIFGISTFGKADVYVRTSVGPELKTEELFATKIAADLWELKLDSDYCAGFYRVVSILPVIPDMSLSGALHITNTVFNYRQFSAQRNNEIPSLLDARFTKYQTATVKFNYTEDLSLPPTAIGDSSLFNVTVSYQPHIAEIQDLLLSDSERFACADYLVKAVLPCFVSLQIDLVRKKSSDTYDSLKLNNLKQDIFNYINTIPFGEDLYASKIVDLCHNYDIATVNLPITLDGNIFCNDGTTIALTSSDSLTIPTNIAKGISKKTTLFFIDYYREKLGEAANVIDSIGLNLL